MDVYPHDISQYSIKGCIGYGGMSEVYHAVCETNKQHVAIKKIDMELYPVELEFLRQEVSFWKSSMNPNIVKYYGSFTSGSVFYMLMEYLEFGSVYDIIRHSCPRGIKSEECIATILKGILMALNYIHSSKQIHRDLKPGNVLISADGSVKLADFGVSASLIENGQKQSARYTLIGTPCYMAPEVLKEHVGYTEKADIWSLGITAIELATGEAPYSRLKPMEAMVQIMSNPPQNLPPNGPFSNEFRDFVGKCLRADPGKRPTAEALLGCSFFAKAGDGNSLVNLLLKGVLDVEQRFKIYQQVRRQQGLDEIRLSLNNSSNEEKTNPVPDGWDFAKSPVKKKESLQRSDSSSLFSSILAAVNNDSSVDEKPKEVKKTAGLNLASVLDTSAYGYSHRKSDASTMRGSSSSPALDDIARSNSQILPIINDSSGQMGSQTQDSLLTSQTATDPASDLRDESKEELISKGRFTITKQPSSGGALYIQPQTQEDLAKKVLILNKKVVVMSYEMESMREQIRMLTETVQSLMQ